MLPFLITHFLATGCSEPSYPSKDEVISRLSYVILDPEVTCSQLRDEFQLHHLQVVDTPDEIGLEYEAAWVHAPSGKRISVWHLPARLDRGVVVLSMGASGSKACYLFVAQLLVDNGWSVVMYDYEGFGQSEGDPNILNLLPDVETVVDWTRDRTGRRRVTAMGISLGTIPSVALAVKRPDAVNAVILDSPVALSAELERFDFVFQGRSSNYIDQLDEELVTESIISRMYQPALILLNEQDRVTPPRTIELLYDRAGGPKQLVRFPNLDHALAPYVDTALYSVNLELFLSGVWALEDAIGGAIDLLGAKSP